MNQNPPQSVKNANKEEDPGMAYRYERAYQSLFTKLSEQMKTRVLAVKSNPDMADRDVDDFIKEVMTLAESDKEL